MGVGDLILIRFIETRKEFLNSYSFGIPIVQLFLKHYCPVAYV